MLSDMDWKKIIAEIIWAGYTQDDIALVAGIKQPSVSQIANGLTANPSWHVGNEILKLHRRALRRQKACDQ